MIVIGVIAIVGTVSAATTISTDIITDGNVGIGTSTPYAKLSVAGQAVVNNIWATSTTATNYFGGNVGIGTMSPESQIHLVASGGPGVKISDYINGVAGPRLWFTRARGTVLAPTSVQDGDTLGYFVIQGYDGTSFLTTSRIRFEVDGATGVNDIPSRITFQTTPDGTSSAVEVMRINNEGKVGIGTTTPTTQLHVTASASNATSTVTVGKVGQNKGSCLELFDAVGTTYYLSVVGGALQVTTVSCK